MRRPLVHVLGPLGVLVGVSCAAPFVFTPPTPEAVAARRIGRALERCLDDANGWPAYVRACSHDAAAACHRASLPKDCGQVEMWFRYVGNPRRRVLPPMGATDT